MQHEANNTKNEDDRALMMILEMTNFAAAVVLVVIIGAINWLYSIDYTANNVVVDRLIWCICVFAADRKWHTICFAFDIWNALHTFYNEFHLAVVVTSFTIDHSAKKL